MGWWDGVGAGAGWGCGWGVVAVVVVMVSFVVAVAVGFAAAVVAAGGRGHLPPRRVCRFPACDVPKTRLLAQCSLDDFFEKWH